MMYLVPLLFGLVWLSLIVFSILTFVFWIMMLIDAAKRDNFANDSDRVIWIIVIALVGAIGAVIYYFAIKRPLDSSKKRKKSPAKKR